MIFEMYLIILLSAAWLQIIFKNKRFYLIFLALFSFLIIQYIFFLRMIIVSVVSIFELLFTNKYSLIFLFVLNYLPYRLGEYLLSHLFTSEWMVCNENSQFLYEW